MFHPSNGRDNFESFEIPPYLAAQLPGKEIAMQMLRRENELRLSEEVQELYRHWDSSLEITDEVQRRVAHEFGFTDLHIVRAIVSAYSADPEVSSIPHYVKFNRSKKCLLECGMAVPDVTVHELDGKQVKLSKYVQAGRPLMISAGSYT